MMEGTCLEDLVLVDGAVPASSSGASRSHWNEPSFASRSAIYARARMAGVGGAVRDIA